MKILSVRTLKGPNLYSYRPVLKVRLDLGGYESIASNAFGGVVDKLLAWLPGLAEHQCSYGLPGGFVMRLREGTYGAHIFEHIILELQTLAGCDIRFGKARWSGKKAIYDVVVGYRSEPLAREAAQAALDILLAAYDTREQSPAVDIPDLIVRLRAIGDADRLGPSTQAIYDAACQRNIPVTRIGSEDLLLLGYGCKQQKAWATVTNKSGLLASDLAGDKHLTKQVLADAGLPVPEGVVVTAPSEAADALAYLDRPVAIKPVNANQGKGVTLDVRSYAAAERAFAIAREFDERVIVEEFISGRQYRLCVVNGKLVAAAERLPAYVTGDGVSTVDQLVDAVNADPRRGDGHEKSLTKIRMDAVAMTVLAKQGLSGQSVPPAGKTVMIRENANLSTGGTAVDVTDMVHPDTRRMIERAAGVIGLDIVGIDVVTPDITRSLGQVGAIIEVNAAPGIRMHHYPSAGKPRDVAGQIIDYLFPDGDQGRIPVIAITGTNGKTTVTRMIGHICQQAGYKVGMTTTDGIYIDGQCVMDGDTTGSASARLILSDPTVQVAVLETARGGILRGGLAFDRCDVGIITNITEDHLGQDGIEDMDDLAYAKALVLETVKPDGYALINADDPRAGALAARAQGEIVYFSTAADNVLVRRHLGIGGTAFFVRDGIVCAAAGSQAQAIIKAEEIPATLGGIALHNLQNAIIAAAACYSLRLPLESIRQGLAGFAENPGRLNIISLDDFRICVDYGHNPAGYQAIIDTSRRLGAKRLVGVIAAPGDRRNDVIMNNGRIAGRGFDMIYIKEDQDLRGRLPGETAGLLRTGVMETGFPEHKIHLVLAEADAVRTALENAQPDDLIIVFYEKYHVVMEAIEDYRQAQRDLPEAWQLPEQQAVVACSALGK